MAASQVKDASDSQPTSLDDVTGCTCSLSSHTVTMRGMGAQLLSKRCHLSPSTQLIYPHQTCKAEHAALYQLHKCKAQRNIIQCMRALQGKSNSPVSSPQVSAAATASLRQLSGSFRAAAAAAATPSPKPEQDTAHWSARADATSPAACPHAWMDPSANATLHTQGAWLEQPRRALHNAFACQKAMLSFTLTICCPDRSGMHIHTV